MASDSSIDETNVKRRSRTAFAFFCAVLVLDKGNIWKDTFLFFSAHLQTLLCCKKYHNSKACCSAESSALTNVVFFVFFFLGLYCSFVSIFFFFFLFCSLIVSSLAWESLLHICTAPNTMGARSIIV